MAENKTTTHPFPGLRPFEEDEEHLFFGREKAVAELLSRLRTSHFLAVIGTSGCGKSSLIKAGLLPALYCGFMAGAGSGWRTAIFRPGDDPIGNLAKALAGTGILSEAGDRQDEEKRQMQGKLIETTLRRSHRGLIAAVELARLPQHENLLLVIDQFEEIFRYGKIARGDKGDKKQDVAAFVQLLLEAGRQIGLPIYIILTMRSDFLGDCTDFLDLPEAINRGQYLIPRMTREEKRAAISGPIAVGGGAISSPLLARLLNDVGDNPDQLPILQHALMRTWDYWLAHRKAGKPLDIEHYEAIGGMERALSRHAEEAYAELKTEKSQRICEQMFKLLTEQEETGRGVRRPAAVSEICSVSQSSEKEVIQVIDVFRKPGRTFLMPPSTEKLQAGSVIDISHESLMRIWTRLTRWVIEEAKSAGMYLDLARASRLYEAGKVSLFRDPELSLALKWREENKPNAAWAVRYDPSFERANLFLDASKKQQDLEIKEKEKQQKAKIRRARLIAGVIGIAALVSIAFALWALKSKHEEAALRKIAVSERIEAQKQKEIAKSKERDAEQQRKIAEIEKNKAVKAREEADNNAKIAEEAGKKAQIEEQKAKENAFQAYIQGLTIDMNTAEANYRGYLAKSRELALHSLAETEDKELKTLLALTAHSLYSSAFDGLLNSSKEILEKFSGLDILDGKDKLQGIQKWLDWLWKWLRRSRTMTEPTEIFSALRAAYIAGEQTHDVIYENAESWALAAVDADKIVFNTRMGVLTAASLQTDNTKLPTLNKSALIALTNNGAFQAAVFTRSGNRLFCGTAKGNLVSWDISTWEMFGSPAAHGAKVLAMTFSRNKNCLFYSVDNRIYRYETKLPGKIKNAAGTEPVVTFTDSDYIRALVVIEDEDNAFLIAAAGGDVFYFDLSGDMQEKKKLPADFRSSGFFAGAYNAKKKLLALANSQGEILIFPQLDCRALLSDDKIQPYKLEEKHGGIVRALAFSPAGKYLASGGLDGMIMLWEARESDDGENVLLQSILSFTGKLKILSLVFTVDEEYLVFCDEQNLRICPTAPQTFYEKLCRGKRRGFSNAERAHYIGDAIDPKDTEICTGEEKNED